jgi:hypothetical protein
VKTPTAPLLDCKCGPERTIDQYQVIEGERLRLSPITVVKSVRRDKA